MTYDEFAIDVGRRLLRAHNAKDTSFALNLFNEADKRLNLSSASNAQRLQFWAKVQREFNSGPFLIEDQANSALHVLMRLIHNNLSVRQAGK